MNTTPQEETTQEDLALKEARDLLHSLTIYPKSFDGEFYYKTSDVEEVIAGLLIGRNVQAREAERLQADNQLLEQRNEAIKTVATTSVKTSMAAARTARQMIEVLKATGPTVEGYQGVMEVLIENLETYTPDAPQN